MRTLYAAVTVLMVGCGGQTLDVGYNETTGRKASTDKAAATLPSSLQPQAICNAPIVDAPNAAWPDPVACAASASGTQSDIVGVWEGYTEDANFNPLAPCRLELLAAAPGGKICGTFKYGSGEPPPLTNDPTVIYPPLASGYYGSNTMTVSTGTPQQWGLLTGFTYTIVDGGMADNKVRLQVSAGEHYKGWCGLQSVYATGVSYACSPLLQGNNGDVGSWSDASPDFCQMTKEGVTIELPAAQCKLCGGFAANVCACDSCHCTAAIEVTHGLDLLFSGDAATGTTGIYHGPSMPTPNPVAIRLKRVQK